MTSGSKMSKIGKIFLVWFDFFFVYEISGSSNFKFKAPEKTI